MNKRLLQSYPDYYFYNEDQPPVDGGNDTPTKEGYTNKWHPIPPDLVIPAQTENLVISTWYLADNLEYPAFDANGKVLVTYKNETFQLDYNDEVIIERAADDTETVQGKYPKNAEEFDVSPLTESLRAAELLFQIPNPS